MTDFRPTRFQILPPVVKNLLILNGLMWVASIILLNTQHINLADTLGLRFFTSEYFRPWQLITHMFMHSFYTYNGDISFMHILSNMFALWMFGSVLENVWGSKRFAIFYLICGLGGALCHMGVTAFEIYNTQQDVNAYLAHPGFVKFTSLLSKFNRDLPDFISAWRADQTNPDFIEVSRQYAQMLVSAKEDGVVIGASGAVFGVLLGFGMLFPNTYLYLLFLPVPVKAKYFVGFYMLFELYAGITGARDGIAHFAHLGGALFGFIMIKLWNKNRRHFY